VILRRRPLSLHPQPPPTLVPQVVDTLRRAGFAVCGVYCLDATFVTDAAKLIAGNLAALAAMMHLELPHINVGARGGSGGGVVVRGLSTPATARRGLACRC
jgi:hypothetical protein